MVHSINDSAWSWDKCLLLLSVVLCFGCSTQNEGPRARIEPSEVTIETSSSDDAGKIEFRISNIGTKAFNVLHFSASCGCTSTDIHPKHILPGKEAILTATVRPMNSGSLRVAVETITDIPDQKMLTAFINIKGKGKVPTPFKVFFLAFLQVHVRLQYDGFVWRFFLLAVASSGLVFSWDTLRVSLDRPAL